MLKFKRTFFNLKGKRLRFVHPSRVRLFSSNIYSAGGVFPARPRQGFYELPSSSFRFGKQLRDDFHWLRYQNNPALDQETLGYLQVESQQTQQFFRGLGPTFSKTAKRLKELSLDPSTDSVPEQLDQFFYSTSLSINSKKKEEFKYLRTTQLGSPPEVLLTHENKFSLGSIKISPNHQLLAWTSLPQSSKGDEKYSFCIKHLSSKNILEKSTRSNVVSFEWNFDSSMILYTTLDHQTLRPSRLYCHSIENPENDILLFEENDPSFYLDIHKTKDGLFFTINCNSKSSSEVYLLDARQPLKKKMKLIQSRQPALEYFVDRIDSRLVIVTNADDSKNYKVVQTSMRSPQKKNWKTVIPESRARIEDMDLMASHLVLLEREQGLPQLRTVSLDSGESRIVPLPEPVCKLNPGLNPNPKSSLFRFSYSSPFTPSCTLDYDLDSSRLHVLQHLRSPLTPSDYVCSRVVSPGGVPITLVHHSSFQPGASWPLLVTAYGAYGHCLEATYAPELALLLERQWVIALVHARGGGELGWDWYASGRRLFKSNTFLDIQESCQWLLAQRYGVAGRVAGLASSAGGLALAAVANRHPNLFSALALQAPFVDVVSTMSDASLPLTVHEYDEWGDPHDPTVLDAMISWDPYLNLPSENTSPHFPALFVSTSLSDPRVPYWIPAKYVAKMRHLRPSTPVFFSVDQESGHFDSLELTAQKIAFLINQIEKKN